MHRVNSILVLLFLYFVIWWLGAVPADTPSGSPPAQDVPGLAEHLLSAVKSESATHDLEHELDSLKMEELMAGLSNDAAKKAFWINLYNAYFQILSIREKKKNPEIFKGRLIPVAGHSFSLDDIEHGILRRYRWKYGMGYLPQFLPSKIIKQLAVSKTDFRIHFALNCGAKSCPPIAFYDHTQLDAQLEVATKSFLHSETEMDTVNKIVFVSKILQWFKGDFGGSRGILSMLSKVLEFDFTGYEIRFKEYDWTAQLRNYSSE